MNSDDILWNPRLLHHLVRQRCFDEDKLVFVDVGMRAGIPQYWTMLKDQFQVIGFEPDLDECSRLNGLETEWTQTCYPYALDSKARTRHLYHRSHNRAADGLYRWTWWWERFGIASVDEVQEFQRYSKKEPLEATRNRTEIDTRSYTEIACQEGLPSPDFFKIDVEGAELDVLRGAEPFLDSDGVLGIELEVQFLPIQDCPLLIEVYNYLAEKGFYLSNLSTFRVARRVLPLPLLWDHRDHRGAPLMHGFTTRGQLGSADAFFARDLIADGFTPATGDRRGALRILKAAAMFELYNMPDCAAELLLYYHDVLAEVVDISSCLDQLVPEEGVKSGAASYETYLDTYRRRNGRLMAIDTQDVGVANPAVTEEPPLIALDLEGGEALASSDNDGSPDRAFDDDPQSFWVSAERGPKVKGVSWIGYGFAAPCVVREITIEQSTGRHYRQEAVRVEKSSDGGTTWQPALNGAVRLLGKTARIELPGGAPAPLWRLVAAGDNATEAEDAWTVTALRFLGEADPATVPLAIAFGQGIASSDGGGAPDRAFDGNPDSFWVSIERGSAVQNNSWIGCQFAQPQIVRWLRIEQSTRPNFRQDSVRVEKSEDGGIWVAAMSEPARLVGKMAWVEIPPGEAAAYWRLLADSANAVDSEDAWTVIDLRFFGEPGSAPMRRIVSDTSFAAGPDAVRADDDESKLIRHYEERIAALERLAGRQALELDLLRRQSASAPMSGLRGSS